MVLVVDPSGEGLGKVLRDYQEEALRFIWTEGDEGVGSKKVYLHVNEALRGVRTISRASIINFLNAMVDEGVLGYVTVSGKGGYRRSYSGKMDERGFKVYIAETVIRSLLRDFPEETREVIREL